MICNFSGQNYNRRHLYLYEEDNHNSDGRAPHNGSTGSETD